MKRNKEEFIMECNQAIDLDKVLAQIASFSSFSLSKNEIVNAYPTFDRMEIQEKLDTVEEMIAFLQTGANVSMAGCSDVSVMVHKAEKEMTLSAQECNDVASFLVSVKSVQASFDSCHSKNIRNLSETMEPCNDLIRQIQAMIDASGEVKNDATDLLKRKYKALVDTRLSLNDKARGFIKRNSSSLMETMTTTIGGRLSVLVKAQDKNKFGGMIHGQSQSGLASYIEPSEFVELNNRIQTIQIDIDEEKKRICKELTKKISSKALFILSDLETMTILDVALTKAKWSIRYDGCVPSLHAQPRHLRMEMARHPLIDEKKCVPNTYNLKSDENCLMISGPNMGGKTVTLKTIGLFVTLAHMGFPVLCHRASIPTYSSIYLEIGDNQSIENNLSTFSSHISKIAKIAKEADARSFVLLDEIGNGTDPLEGSSLAIAILEDLIDKQCTVITSTHYAQVKAFGKTNGHVLVSSVEFDGNTLKPTYRYIPGVSGASYAFSIARQYELKDSILERAQFYKNENEEKQEKELEKLERLQNEVLIEKKRFNKIIEDAHRLQKEAASEKRNWEKKNKELQDTYDEKLRDMLEEKEAEANLIITELKSLKNAKSHQHSDLLHQMHVLQQEVEPEEPVKEVQESFKVGDYVQIDDLNSHGEIIELRKKEATIITNGMKMKVKCSRLHKIHKPMVNRVPDKKHVDRQFKRFPLEINLIGMHVEEGIHELDNYIDQAIYHKVKQVRVIHGMGTGVLRTAVWKYLDKHPHVASKTSAGPAEGGLGATIVLLK